ncbi:MAG: phosphodiester glycosidase family protein [Clostridia bacterium]|nr:phosphodiester glycosidase family protein [Clostridia bacterium]
MKKWLTAFFALAAFLFALSVALADEAPEITDKCGFKSSGTKFKYTQMTDGKYTTYWDTHEAKHNYLQITAPNGQKIYGLYLCFRSMPDAYEVQTAHGSDWQTVYVGDTEIYHAFYSFDGGVSSVRVYVPTTTKQVLGFNEVFAFGEGEIPDWVQRWEPTVEKADILFLVAHPDDELIFMAGGIPTAIDEGRSVAVAYMTYSNTTRRSELLNGLWLLGVRNYPVIGNFKDSYQKNLKTQYKSLGGEEKVNAWVTEVIRRLKPEVIVTQDEDGEYGHPMHKVISEAARNVWDKTADATYCPESAEAYGTWQAKKLYVHLWSENASLFDWETPLSSFDGKTGMELAIEAYELHITQKTSGMSVTKTGAEYDNHRFGLFASTVGPDETGGDFFENIDASAPIQEVEIEAVPMTLPEEELSPVEDEISETKIEVIYVEENNQNTENAQSEDPLPLETETTGTWVETDEDLAAILPPLNAKGYLDEGEFVYSSDEQGLYIYVSQTLKVVIRRSYEVPDKKHAFYCFTAHVWCDTEAGMLPQTIFTNPEKPRSTHDNVKDIATNNKVVFATSTDYYTYRIKQTYPTGIIVRGGQIFYDEPRRNPPTMPNYETLAFFPDGHIESYLSTEKSAQDYLDAGAYDVYCFGPCLIRDGEPTPYIATANTSYNPRYAFGTVEPGHYVAILCEGRLARSKGVQMKYLAELLQREGCDIAVNLDGGQTAVFCFMGKQLNQVDKSIPYGRKQAEILAFGTSEQVGDYEIGP